MARISEALLLGVATIAKESPHGSDNSPEKKQKEGFRIYANTENPVG